MTFAWSGNSALQRWFPPWYPPLDPCSLPPDDGLMWSTAGRSQACSFCSFCSLCGSLQLQRLLAPKNNLSDHSGYLLQTNFTKSLGIFFWNNDFLYNLINIFAIICKCVIFQNPEIFISPTIVCFYHLEVCTAPCFPFLSYEFLLIDINSQI